MQQRVSEGEGGCTQPGHGHSHSPARALRTRRRGLCHTDPRAQHSNEENRVLTVSSLQPPTTHGHVGSTFSLRLSSCLRSKCEVTR